MPEAEFELAEIQARIKRGNKMKTTALLVFLALICLARWGWGLPLPNRIIILIIFWLGVSSVYGLLVGGQTSVKMIRMMYSRYFLLEMLILTFLLIFSGFGRLDGCYILHFSHYLR